MKMYLRLISRIASMLCTLLLFCVIAISANAQTLLTTTFDSNGLSNLTYGSTTLFNPSVGVGQPFYIEGTRPTDNNRIWNPDTKTLTWKYQWGNAACKYIPSSTRLDLEITLTNTTGGPVSGLNIFPMGLKFPQIPVGYNTSTPHVGFNTDGPTVQSADFGTGMLTIVNQDVFNPQLPLIDNQLNVGFFTTDQTTPTNPLYSIYVGSKSLSYAPPNWPQFNRNIRPGSDSRNVYHISLRFSPSGTDTYIVANDIYTAYAKNDRNPMQLNWRDRRSIGALLLSSAPPHPTNNPHGWFTNDSSINTNTPEGLVAFKRRLEEYAAYSVKILKENNSQGMITWDIEGQEYPHTDGDVGASFIGDPRVVSSFAPEIEPLLKKYFKTFTDEGLRVGICIRPQQVKNSNGSDITQGTLESAVNNPIQRDVTNISQQLLAKIDYAKAHWGCTLFYIDSTSGPQIPAEVVALKAISAARPDILLMPENESFSYYPYSAPFNDLNGDGPVVSFSGTPADVKKTYPNAFTVIKVDYNDSPDRFNSLRPEVVQAVRNGDVLIYNAWYDSPLKQPVNSVYSDVYASLRVTTTQDIIANDGLVSLREAINYANSNSGYNIISFAQSAQGIIKLNGTALPTVTKNCLIIGPGKNLTTGENLVAIDGALKSRILKIEANADVTVDGLNFSNGKAQGSDNNGGEFYNNGSLTIANCSVKNNVGFYGGSAYNNVNGTLLLVNSTFNDNSATDSGGVMANLGTVRATGCTFSNNTTSASGGTGGAGLNSYGGSSSINLNFCTVTANNGGNTVSNARAGIWMEQSSRLHIANTIIYGNGTRDIQQDVGSVASAGYNLVGNKGSANGFLSTDKIGVNPLLGPLAKNGGPTLTRALLAGSPAINAANPTTNPVDFDQRGVDFLRVFDHIADIGAVESNFTGPSGSSS